MNNEREILLNSVATQPTNEMFLRIMTSKDIINSGEVTSKIYLWLF